MKRRSSGAGWRIADLRNEGVFAAAVRGLHRVERREVGRGGNPRDVDVAGRVHREGEPAVCAAAAEVGGEDERRAGRVELRHEGVQCRRRSRPVWD